jgi:transposase
MKEKLRFLGLDVHAETIAVAIAEPDGEVRSLGTIPNRTESIRKLIKKLRPTEKLRACYEAGPTGKFLLRSGQRLPFGVRPWTRPYLIWVAQLRFTQMAQEATRQDYLHEVEHMRERVARLEQAITEAVKLASPALQQVINDLQALRGIADISAVTIAAELGQVSRFESARQLMGYCGAVPSEDSSGKRTRRGSITKTGNAHLRRIVVEAAWSYRRPPCIWYGLRRRQESISQEAKEIAWKAQHRLHKRYMRLGAAGKDRRKITTAVARELLGFIWAIGTRAETVAEQRVAA